jgi:predicted esterase
MGRLALFLALAACSRATTTHGGAPPDSEIVRDTPKSVDAPPDAPSYANLCAAPRPPHATVPDQPALPAAGCPTLVPGANTITSAATQRSFLLVLPSDFRSDEQLPVLFLWHWLKGSAQDFLDKGDVQNAADQQRFIAVLPNSIGATVFGLNLNTDWPFDITQSQQRMTQEFQFFDDMLACVEQQLHVNSSCVASAGVSAGALFTDQLVQARSNMLASFMSMSGGVNDTIIKPWTAVPHQLPAFVLWGGDGPPNMDGRKDILGCLGFGMDFSVASRDLEMGLVAGNQFMVECRHDCGHVEPPFDPPPGLTKYAGLWDFALNHPFYLAAGQSPYLQSGLPAGAPPWCAIGAGNSIPRNDAATCPPAANPCAF